MRKLLLLVLCLALLASVLTASAEDATQTQGGPSITVTKEVRATRNNTSDGWPSFFTGLILGAGIGAAVASVCVIACNYLINRKGREKHEDSVRNL